MKLNFNFGKSGKVHILLGGEYFITVDEDFILSCGYADGDDIEGAELAAFIEAAGLRSAFVAALRLLSNRDYGRKELENKLVLKGIERDFARAAALKAEDLGYVDDEAYAAMLARRLSENKGYSSKKIKYELAAKGISHETAEIACENLDNNPVLRIIELLNTKYCNSLNDEKGTRRTVAALTRLGYGYSDIRTALREYEISVDAEDCFDE